MSSVKRQIQQETFNDVVKENMEEFDMTAEEAIADAVQQFEAQDVDLSNIIKGLALEGTAEDKDMIPPVIRVVESLKHAVSKATAAHNSRGETDNEEHTGEEDSKDKTDNAVQELVGALQELIDLFKSSEQQPQTSAATTTTTENQQEGNDKDDGSGNGDSDEDSDETKKLEAKTDDASKHTRKSPHLHATLGEERVLAAAKGAFPTLMQICEVLAERCTHSENVYGNNDNSNDNNDTPTCHTHLALALEALSLLLDGQPDLVSPPNPDCVVADVKHNDHVTQICNHLKQFARDGNVQYHAIVASRHACTKHETNRQTFVAEGLVEYLLHCIEHHSAHPAAVAEAARCLRALTRDDDIRVAFGKGHEHAKLMVTEHGALGRIMRSLAAFTEDPVTTAELCKTLARISVRNEFCQEIVDLGGLELILPALHTHNSVPDVAVACMQVLGAIAGNDDVKGKIREVGGIEVIIDTMQAHQKRKAVIDKGCGALAALCLRDNDNCKAVVEYSGAAVIVRGMIMFPENTSLQRNACRALRNIAARNPDLRQRVLNEGAEHYLNVALQKKACHDDAKAALRDLGCKVHLTEEWKGKRGELEY